MARKFYILINMAVCLAFLATNAEAQDEQWLQYHSAREISLSGFSTTVHNIGIETGKPESVELPIFSGESQIFTKWHSPMVQNEFLWIALDQTNKNGLYDILYIDSNGDGNLNDEEGIKSYRITQTYAYFGPVKVIFQIEDGPVAYHLNFRYYGYNDTKRLYVSSGGWYQGEISVGDDKMSCVIFDYNANGKFNDSSIDSMLSDRIRISNASNVEDTRYVGKYIDINGIMYEPEIAPDGAYIKLLEAKDVQYGKIQLHDTITQFSARGENGLFYLEPENGIASLPVGKYQINQYTIERKDDKDIHWKLEGSNFTRPQDDIEFEVSEDQINDSLVDIGEPVIAILNASVNSGQYNFSQRLIGKNNETINLTRNGSRPQAPKLNIKNEDGTYDRTYSFSYG